MRILFLTDNFPPEVNAPATRTYEHCKEWVKQGVDVTVITCFPNFPQGKVYDGYKNKRIEREEKDGIKVIRVWSYIAENKGFAKRVIDFVSFSFSAFFAGLFQKTDVIIATTPQFFTALAGRTLSFCKGKPWVMEVRDLWPESIKTVGAMKDNLFIRYFEKEEMWCYKSAAKIVVVTDSFKNTLIGKGIDKDKIEVVKNGANLELFKHSEKDKDLVNKLRLNGKTVLAYVGTIGMAHNIGFILDCAKHMKNTSYHFLIVGDGAERCKLEERAKKEQLLNVSFIKSVPKNEVVKYLSLADIALINLRSSELFKTVIPSKIFESAAMQIPILIGVDGEARSIIEQYEAGLYYEPENIDDFLEKLEKICIKEQYEKCQEGGRKIARAFDRKLQANSMFDVLRGLSSKNNARRTT
ncbi:MAG: glycosyltransferase family 4 protein [Bacteroidales bacterium]